jgi:1,4-alpha-glucan branching enzyme
VTAVQVWSGEHGYPGDPEYLDFHKKRFPGGHRYWRVTHPKADLAHKEIYRPERAGSQAPQHAAHFVSLLGETLGAAAARGAPPIACAMFDTELFGHWWFEGPGFLGQVLDRLRGAIEPASPSDYLGRHPAAEAISLPEGSWGDGGGHAVWLNADTRWTWSLIHTAEARFEALARQARDHGGAADPLLERLMRQAGRELLLLEASDWQFLITTFSARDYAELRLAQHVADFERLASLAERRAVGGAVSGGDEHFLAECERRDSLFPDLDWRAWAASGRSGAVATR